MLNIRLNFTKEGIPPIASPQFRVLDALQILGSKGLRALHDMLRIYGSTYALTIVAYRYFF